MAQSETGSLEVQEKKELVQDGEKTVPAKYYAPYTDIYETADALTVIMEMAGVEKENIDIQIENDVLQVEGRVDLSSYADMQPAYSEYALGNYSRSFGLSSKIDREGITAGMVDGVLTLRLPKAQEAQPRRIEIG